MKFLKQKLENRSTKREFNRESSTYQIKQNLLNQINEVRNIH